MILFAIINKIYEHETYDKILMNTELHKKNLAPQDSTLNYLIS